MKCTLNAMKIFKILYLFPKKLYLYIIFLTFIPIFWECLDIMPILHIPPNATKINMIIFPLKIFNFWRFNMNSQNLESQQRVAVNGYPFGREDMKMKCALKAMIFSNSHIYFWKKLCLYIISFSFILIFLGIFGHNINSI